MERTNDQESGREHLDALLMSLSCLVNAEQSDEGNHMIERLLRMAEHPIHQQFGQTGGWAAC